MSMLLDVIDMLKGLGRIHGNVEFEAFHHDGGNSLRAGPREVTKESFVLETKKGKLVKITLGGWFK